MIVSKYIFERRTHMVFSIIVPVYNSEKYLTQCIATFRPVSLPDLSFYRFSDYIKVIKLLSISQKIISYIKMDKGTLPLSILFSFLFIFKFYNIWGMIDSLILRWNLHIIAISILKMFFIIFQYANRNIFKRYFFHWEHILYKELILH